MQKTKNNGGQRRIGSLYRRRHKMRRLHEDEVPQESNTYKINSEPARFSFMKSMEKQQKKNQNFSTTFLSRPFASTSSMSHTFRSLHHFNNNTAPSEINRGRFDMKQKL